jgi:hypothetical protein
VCIRLWYQKQEKSNKKPENPLKFESVIFPPKRASFFDLALIFSGQQATEQHKAP